MRPIIIQKFGGTSLQKSDLRQAAIQHVKAMVAKQKAVVMVVSALGRLGDPYATDSLLELVHGQTGKLNFQELDQLTSLGETISMLVMVNELRQQGLDAVGLSGGKQGFKQRPITKPHGLPMLTLVQLTGLWQITRLW